MPARIAPADVQATSEDSGAKRNELTPNRTGAPGPRSSNWRSVMGFGGYFVRRPCFLPGSA